MPLRELPRTPLASKNVFALQARCSSQARGGGGFKRRKTNVCFFICLQMTTAHPLQGWWSCVLLYWTCLVSQSSAQQIAHSARSRLMRPCRRRAASGSMEALSWFNEKFSLIKERAIWHTQVLSSPFMNVIMTFQASEGTLAEMHIEQPEPSAHAVILSLWPRVIFSLPEPPVKHLTFNNQHCQNPLMLFQDDSSHTGTETQKLDSVHIHRVIRKKQKKTKHLPVINSWALWKIQALSSLHD